MAKKFEREHNARAWAVWHIAALQRMKKMPDIKKLMTRNTSQPRQTWRQQIEVMKVWASEHNAFIERQKQMENADGR